MALAAFQGFLRLRRGRDGGQPRLVAREYRPRGPRARGGASRALPRRPRRDFRHDPALPASRRPFGLGALPRAGGPRSRRPADPDARRAYRRDASEAAGGGALGGQRPAGRGARGGPGGERGQEPFSGEDEPRDPDADDRRARHGGPAGRHASRRRAGADAGRDPALRRAAHGDAERHPRRLQDRGGGADDGARAGIARRSRRAGRGAPCGESGGDGHGLLGDRDLRGGPAGLRTASRRS